MSFRDAFKCRCLLPLQADVGYGSGSICVLTHSEGEVTSCDVTDEDGFVVYFVCSLP